MSTTAEPAALHPNHALLIEACTAFLSEVENLTPGTDLETRLNTEYGPSSQHHRTFTTLVKSALSASEPWFAHIPISGPTYRRSPISLPSASTKYFSITAVYFNKVEEFRGQYHKHPYGEINCVIPITEGAELMGPNGWQGAGWTSPGPGSEHFPLVRGGELVSLFFLPAGRIEYKSAPGEEEEDGRKEARDY